MKKYIIDENELYRLLKYSMILEALENGGVDNWEWYGDSIYDYKKNLREDFGEYITENEDDVDVMDLAIEKCMKEYKEVEEDETKKEEETIQTA